MRCCDSPIPLPACQAREDREEREELLLLLLSCMLDLVSGYFSTEELFKDKWSAGPG